MAIEVLPMEFDVLTMEQRSLAADGYFCKEELQQSAQLAKLVAATTIAKASAEDSCQKVQPVDTSSAKPMEAKAADNTRCQYLTEAVLDELDNKGVSCEMLAVWKAREERTLHPFLAVWTGSGGLPPQARCAVLHWLACMMPHRGQPESTFFEIAQLMDTFHLKTASNCAQLAIDNLPMTCAALICILQKMDVANCAPLDCVLLDQVQTLGQYLSLIPGCETVHATVTEEMVNAEEKRILQVLGWQVTVPTVWVWINAFTVRLNLLCRGLLPNSAVRPVWNDSLIAARIVVMQKVLGKDLPPRMLATGLFSIGLVGSHLLPLEAMQPPKLTGQEWMDLYEDIRPQEPHPQCMIPHHYAMNLFDVLALTVGVDAHEIQECCHLAALTMRSVIHGDGTY